MRPAELLATNRTGAPHHGRAHPVSYRLEPTDPALVQYLRSLLASATVERCHAVFCDRDREYLHDETLAHGGPTRLVGRARPLFERALSLGAAGVLLAHNHPSGDCRPSEYDIESTKRLIAIGAALEIEFLDHLIFAPGRYCSMVLGGYL